MKSHSGLLIRPRYCLAYAESDSTYRRWPSAYMVSKARDDLPEPETPAITINLLRGIFRLTFFRLFTRAPLISMY